MWRADSEGADRAPVQGLRTGTAHRGCGPGAWRCLCFLEAKLGEAWRFPLVRFGGARCPVTFVLNLRFGRKLRIIRGIVEQEIQAMVSKRENIATHHLYQARDPIPSLSPATTGIPVGRGPGVPGTCGEDGLSVGVSLCPGPVGTAGQSWRRGGAPGGPVHQSCRLGSQRAAGWVVASFAATDS